MIAGNFGVCLSGHEPKPTATESSHPVSRVALRMPVKTGVLILLLDKLENSEVFGINKADKISLYQEKPLLIQEKTDHLL